MFSNTYTVKPGIEHHFARVSTRAAPLSDYGRIAPCLINLEIRTRKLRVRFRFAVRLLDASGRQTGGNEISQKIDGEPLG